MLHKTRLTQLINRANFLLNQKNPRLVDLVRLRAKMVLLSSDFEFPRDLVPVLYECHEQVAAKIRECKRLECYPPAGQAGDSTMTT